MAYDEDLTQNRFFVGLQTECPQLYETASANRFMIFVPRAAALGPDSFSETQYLNHVIQLVDERQTLYKTLSDKEVKISGNTVSTGNGFSEHKEVQVLFEETFFNRSDESFRVLCINQSLEGGTAGTGTAFPEDPNELFSSQIRSLDDCESLLWGTRGSKPDKSRRHLDNLIDLFNKTRERLEKESLRQQVDAANSLFTRSMQLVLKNSHLKKKSKGDEAFMDSVRLAVETYVMHGVYNALFNCLSGCMSSKDAALNKITRNLNHLQLKHLHIKLEFMQNVPRARKELLNLNLHTTPLGKLSCIRRVVKALSQVQRRRSSADSAESPALTTDDLLPLLVYLVVKADVPNWWANLAFVKHCRFSRNSADDEFGFYIATLEAALEHVTTGELGKMDLDPANPQRLQVSPTSQQFLAPGSGTSLWSRQDSTESDVSKLFQFVRDGNPEGVASMLNDSDQELPKGRTSSSPDQSQRSPQCHPLCACDKCSGRVERQQQRQQRGVVTVFSRDEHGATVLHAAAALPDTLIMEALIQRGAVVNAADHRGRTPLHVACERGRQGSAFMLLHYKADVNVQDNDGNSPLHVATSHGHEDCAKALIYYDQGVSALNISAANDVGDTSLHFAAKWGFENIVALLVENGADVTVQNRRRQTPAMMAHNIRVSRLLNDAATRHKQLMMKKSSSTPNLYRLPSNQTASCPNLVGAAVAASPGKPSPSLPGSPATFSHTSPGSSWTPTRQSPTSPPAAFSPTAHKSPLSSSGYATGGMAAILEDQQLDAGAGSAVTSSRHVKQRDPTELERNVEKLLKYVADSDIEMVKYELGWSEEDDELDSSDTGPSSLCHPLCQCKKCRPLQKLTSAAPSGVHVNATNRQGYSSLHVAALHGHVALVELLLLRGADPALRTDTHRATPLHLAAQNNKQFTHKVVRCLVDYGAEMDVTDSTGNTALHYCCLNGNNATALVLLQRGCDVNVANSRGNTALHEASRWNSVALVESLLQHRACVSVRNAHNFTPMQLAQGEKILRLLCEASIQQSSLAAAAAQEEKAASTDAQPEGRAAASPDTHVTEKRLSLRDLFAELEEPEIDKLQQITSSVHTFHLGVGEGGVAGALRRTPETRDRSAPRVDHHVAHVLAIHNYNQDRLQHVEPRVTSDVVVSDEAARGEEELASAPHRLHVGEEGVDIFEEARAEATAGGNRKWTSAEAEVTADPNRVKTADSSTGEPSTKLTKKTGEPQSGSKPSEEDSVKDPLNTQLQLVENDGDFQVGGNVRTHVPQEALDRKLTENPLEMPVPPERRGKELKLRQETVASECESEDSTTESQRDELEVE